MLPDTYKLWNKINCTTVLMVLFAPKLLSINRIYAEALILCTIRSPKFN